MAFPTAGKRDDLGIASFSSRVPQIKCSDFSRKISAFSRNIVKSWTVEWVFSRSSGKILGFVKLMVGLLFQFQFTGWLLIRALIIGSVEFRALETMKVGNWMLFDFYFILFCFSCCWIWTRMRGFDWDWCFNASFVVQFCLDVWLPRKFGKGKTVRHFGKSIFCVCLACNIWKHLSRMHNSWLSWVRSPVSYEKLVTKGSEMFDSLPALYA